MSKRSASLLKACPKCGVGAGDACIGQRGLRKATHAERHWSKPGCKAGVDRPAKRKKAPKIQKTGFYWSEQWRALRYRALVLHGAQCQCCGARPSVGKPLHVDHIKPRSRHPELELDLSNLQVLCADCNIGKGARDQTDWRVA